ncbi:MAG: hypothetical protein JJ992_14055, partial [Planctomycetes bacterium]|nr:hypothetical protein [Planctomycetota bacterium]
MASGGLIGMGALGNNVTINNDGDATGGLVGIAAVGLGPSANVLVTAGEGSTTEGSLFGIGTLAVGPGSVTNILLDPNSTVQSDGVGVLGVSLGGDVTIETGTIEGLTNPDGPFVGALGVVHGQQQEPGFF